jgi:hypothetical protein
MDTIKELAEKYSLILWSTRKTDKGNSYQYMDKLGVNVMFNDWDNSFEFMWIIPKSIFNISCPNCSPYTNKEHFEKMYQKFCIIVLTYSSTYEGL